MIISSVSPVEGLCNSQSRPPRNQACRFPHLALQSSIYSMHMISFSHMGLKSLVAITDSLSLLDWIVPSNVSSSFGCITFPPEFFSPRYIFCNERSSTIHSSYNDLWAFHYLIYLILYYQCLILSSFQLSYVYFFSICSFQLSCLPWNYLSFSCNNV